MSFLVKDWIFDGLASNSLGILMSSVFAVIICLLISLPLHGVIVGITVVIVVL